MLNSRPGVLSQAYLLDVSLQGPTGTLDQCSQKGILASEASFFSVPNFDVWPHPTITQARNPAAIQITPLLLPS